MGNWEDMADRTLKTAINTFKTAGTYTTVIKGTPPVTKTLVLDGVFDRIQQSVDLNTGAKVDSLQPSFGVRMADLTDEFGDDFEIQQGDKLTIRGKNYRVIESIEDGEGGVKILLSKTV